MLNTIEMYDGYNTKYYESISEFVYSLNKKNKWFLSFKFDVYYIWSIYIWCVLYMMKYKCKFWKISLVLRKL